MIILFSLFLRALAILTKTAFIAVSITFLATAILHPLAEFMISVNAWPVTWLIETYTPMTVMEQVTHSLKSTMFAIAFYTIGDQIESWSKRLPSLEHA